MLDYLHRSAVTPNACQLRMCRPHRSMVTDRDAAPVTRVWLLANDATPDAIPHVLMIEAVRLVLAGKGVLILAQRPEPEVDVRTGLLQALDLLRQSQLACTHGAPLLVVASE